ncbi:hypothetical protein KM043_014012 [Ampulex compressa]|nr:hypothetical protein KM043_014012 [Ampulex compressa]
MHRGAATAKSSFARLSSFHDTLSGVEARLSSATLRSCGWSSIKEWGHNFPDRVSDFPSEIILCMPSDVNSKEKNSRGLERGAALTLARQTLPVLHPEMDLFYSRRYYQNVRLFLSVTGLWPYYNQMILLLIRAAHFCVLFVFGNDQVLNIVKSENTLSTLIAAFPIMMTGLICAVKYFGCMINTDGVSLISVANYTSQ